MPEGSRDTSSAPIENPATQPFSWRLFWFLALAMLLAALLGLPYALHILQAGKPDLAIQADVLRREAAVNAVRRVIVFYWPMTWLGLYAAGRIGLGLPVIFAWLQGLPPPLNRRKILRPAAWLGFGTGFAILAITAALSPWTAGELARLNARLPGTVIPGPWQSLLGSISAAVNEEILLRLFLLSCLAWGLQGLFTRQWTGRPEPRILWAANLVAALAFGLLHLPNLSALNIPVSPYLIVFVVSLNAAAGLGFGWLYWIFGLESAILAHFFMDLVLHVLPALLQTVLR